MPTGFKQQWLSPCMQFSASQLERIKDCTGFQFYVDMLVFILFLIVVLLRMDIIIFV